MIVNINRWHVVKELSYNAIVDSCLYGRIIPTQINTIILVLYDVFILFREIGNMKNTLYLILLFPLCATASGMWYRITTDKGSASYDFYGTVDYTPDKFADAIKKGNFIKISNLVYFDNQNRVKPWDDWAPYLKSEVYVRSSAIKMFFPLAGNPGKPENNNSGSTPRSR